MGERVAGLPGRGGYQRFICLAEDDLVAVPPDLTPADAVSLMLNYTTAYQLLTRAARLHPGDTALFHGAAGGVGSAALQLARLLGVKMYGTVSRGKMDTVRQLGGVPIDYQRSDFVRELGAMEPGGVQAVFDPVGGPQLTQSYQALARNGMLVFFGASSAARGAGNPTLALAATGARFLLLRLQPDARKVVIYLIEPARKKHPEHFRQDIGALLALLQAGKIKPLIARVLPLREAGQAHELLEAGKVTGKIILQP